MYLVNTTYRKLLSLNFCQTVVGQVARSRKGRLNFQQKPQNQFYWKDLPCDTQVWMACIHAIQTQYIELNHVSCFYLKHFGFQMSLNNAEFYVWSYLSSCSCFYQHQHRRETVFPKTMHKVSNFSVKKNRVKPVNRRRVFMALIMWYCRNNNLAEKWRDGFCKKRFLTRSLKGGLIVVPYDGGGPLTGEINQLSTSLIKFWAGLPTWATWHMIKLQRIQRNPEAGSRFPVFVFQVFLNILAFFVCSYLSCVLHALREETCT